MCALCRVGATGYDAAYSYGAYEGTLRELIHLLKFRRIETLAAPLGHWLAQALPRERGYDAIVPVPLHWTRWLTRRFNQSELLAREVSRRTGIPLRLWLQRVKRTPQQAGLTAAKRRRNVAGAFRACVPGSKLAGSRVLLVDDVLTTGATLNAAAWALKRAGAKRITVLTVARADRRLVAVSNSVLDVYDSNLAGVRG